MKSFLKFMMVVMMSLMIVGCQSGNGGSTYSDLTIMEGVEIGIEEYGIAFRSGSNMTDKVNDITKDLFLDGTMTNLADTYGLSEQLIDEFKVSETQEVNGEDDYAYLKDNGKMIIGITNFKPMDYLDENGEWIGFDADYANLVCQRLGLEAEFLLIDWNSKEMALQTKQIDCIWNGMTITDAIKNAADVTGAYIKNYQVVVVKDATLTSLESLDGKVVVAEKGSAGETAALADPYLSKEYKPVESQEEALLQVKSGGADACVIDFIMANSLVE